MSHFSPPGMKYNRSSLLSLENNYRHANGGAKTLTIKKLKSVYKSSKTNPNLTMTSLSVSKLKNYYSHSQFGNLNF